MVILLIFNVEAVAKLASAFQLLLFGLLCFAVIVMRESKIDAYAPGFRSPFYPWIQIAGMLISVWLIAEMGLLAVSLTGIIIVLCVAWYYYYTGGKIQRQGAIFHVHERLGRKRYEGLEYELLSILNEKNGEEKRLAYEEVVARSSIIDISSKDPEISGLIDLCADIFAGRLKLDKKRISEDLSERYRHKFTNLGNGVVAGYLRYSNLATAEMVVFRMRKAVEVQIPGINTPVYALIFLVTPETKPGLDMRLVGHLAEIVQPESFLKRWLNAESEKELREILMSDEHFIHVSVDDNRYLKDQIGLKIGEIRLPGESLIAIIYRHGDLIIPHGNTELEPGDELSIIGQPEDIRTLMINKMDIR